MEEIELVKNKKKKMKEKSESEAKKLKAISNLTAKVVNIRRSLVSSK
jgi:hypothetical protein